MASLRFYMYFVLLTFFALVRPPKIVRWNTFFPIHLVVYGLVTNGDRKIIVVSAKYVGDGVRKSIWSICIFVFSMHRVLSVREDKGCPKRWR